MHLLRHSGERLLYSFLLVLASIVLVFALTRLAPGDPLTALVGDYPVPESYALEVRQTYGLDKPAPEQLAIYLGRVLQGDLGHSFKNRQPVANLLIERGRNTLLLAATALALASVVGITLGVLAALHRSTPLDSAVTLVAVVGYSVPVFWLGQLLIMLVALRLQWTPAQGMTSVRERYEGVELWIDVLRHMALPVLVLSFRYVAVCARITRASMVEVLSREFVSTARAKGLPERVVVVRHALRNALLPVVTTIGLEVGLLLSGSALVETVFSWPGLGRLLFDSISARDYPTMQGIFLVVTLAVVAANWATDVLYGILDPRTRYG